MRIIGLRARNIKRVVAVDITPEGNIVKISGDNDQGKSSILDAIMYALGGKAGIPDKPIRKGEDEGIVELDLGQYIATRKFRRKGEGYTSEIMLTSKDGAKYSKPQKILDDLVGKISFDPLEFANMGKQAQLEALQGIVDLGFDLKEWEATRQGLYDNRHEKKRQLKISEGGLPELSSHEDGPDERVSIEEITQELTAASNQRAAKKLAIQEAENHAESIKSKKESLQELDDSIAALNKKRDEMAGAIKDMEDQEVANGVNIHNMPYPDTAKIQARIATAEALNLKYDQNKVHAAKVAETKALADAVKLLEDEYGAHLEIKGAAIRNATFPIEGLSFGEDHVIFKDLPFDQASQSERIRISSAIGMAMNPEIRVLLVRDGSLLGEAAMAVLEGLAQDNDFQVWVEIVDTTGEVGVMIEDGMVVDKDSDSG